MHDFRPLNLVSIGKAAAILGVCIQTLRDWEKAGRIHCHRTIGNHRRYDIDELEQLMRRKGREKAARTPKQELAAQYVSDLTKLQAEYRKAVEELECQQ
jgi:excisionase family DNA binding protein